MERWLTCVLIYKNNFKLFRIHSDTHSSVFIFVRLFVNIFDEGQTIFEPRLLVPILHSTNYLQWNYLQFYDTQWRFWCFANEWNDCIRKRLWSIANLWNGCFRKSAFSRWTILIYCRPILQLLCWNRYFHFFSTLFGICRNLLSISFCKICSWRAIFRLDSSAATKTPLVLHLRQDIFSGLQINVRTSKTLF